MNILQKKKSFRFYGFEGVGRSKETMNEFYKLCNNNLFIDEVMRETADDSKVINNFGTKEKPFSTGMHQMYRKFCDEGKLYHFTTNYWNIPQKENGKMFGDIYGNEIQDRIIEMCNIIEFKGNSKRK